MPGDAWVGFTATIRGAQEEKTTTNQQPIMRRKGLLDVKNFCFMKTGFSGHSINAIKSAHNQSANNAQADGMGVCGLTEKVQNDWNRGRPNLPRSTRGGLKAQVARTEVVDNWLTREIIRPKSYYSRIDGYRNIQVKPSEMFEGVRRPSGVPDFLTVLKRN